MPRTHSPRAARAAAALLGLALAAVLPGAPRAQSLAFEYGPEAEAQFLALCTGAGGAPAACRCVAERLQEQLGYPAFLAAARGGPAAFSGHGATPTAQFALPLAGAEAGCALGLPSLVVAAR